MKFILLILLNTYFSVKAFSQTGTDEKAAIKKLLETESSTWRSGNLQAHAACWQIRPYSRILASTPEGKTFDINPEIMINPPAGMMGKGGNAVNSNYRFSINGSSAWVSHDEISTAADGKKSYSYEIRMLEKVNGSWKLVGQSIHVYKAE
ncbi:endo-arabinase [Pedobacter sp. HMF7647]|uniref:Endo-arabinase n=1 Tax=Hufsiella arboris TaxID=2695275 RepID=A0A7K1Y4Q2_9SPHI|nr:endo-arabinase [Hufsiella arboris]MXV49555.1 endo-arabinase [Hufsiella arboris]